MEAKECTLAETTLAALRMLRAYCQREADILHTNGCKCGETDVCISADINTAWEIKAIDEAIRCVNLVHGIS